MNARHIVLAASLAAGLFTTVFTREARTTDYTWDGQGIGAPSDAGGAWDGGANWYNGTPYTAWSDGNGAVFGAGNGTADTVTIGNVVTPTSITFNPPGSGNYTINGGSIILSGGPTPVNVNNTAATIASQLIDPLTGSGGLTLAGNGYLALSGPNTYSGVTTINGGTLDCQNGSGGPLSSLGSGIVNNSTLFVTLSGGNWGDNVVFHQVISGSGTTLFRETGGSVCYIALGPSAQLSAAGDVVVNTGLLTNGVSPTIGALNGNGYITDYPGGDTLTVVSNGHSGTYSGGSDGSFNLIKTGSGIQVLTSAGYTGSTTISGGTLYANNAALSTTSGIEVNNGGTLESAVNGLFGYSGGTTPTQPITVNAGGAAIADTGVQVTVGLLTLNGGTLAGNYNGSASGSWSFGAAAASQLAVTDNSTVTATGITMYNGAPINVSAGKTLQFNGTIVDGANGPSSLIASGPGTIVLNASNTYTGATTIDAGTLALGASNSISNTSGITVNSSGTLDVSAATGFTIPSGKTITVNGATVGSLVVAPSAILTGSGSLLANAAGQTATIDGLSGANTYSGGTFVEAGTLIVNNSAALPDGSSLTVGAGGTFIFDPLVSDSPVSVAAIAAGSVSAVPEPGTLGLLSIGAMVVLAAAWRRPGGAAATGHLRLDGEETAHVRVWTSAVPR